MKRCYSFVVLCLMSLYLSAPVMAETAKDLSQDAFKQIENQPYDAEAVLHAVNILNQAAVLNLQEPWGYIASTYATLSSGYQGGNRYEITSYRTEEVALAGKLARKAIARGPDGCLSHISLAFVEIIQGNLEGAWQRLETAHNLDPANFYPYYYRGVIATKQNAPAQAKNYFRGAMQRTLFNEHKAWVIAQLQILAALEADNATMEQLMIEAINNEPNTAAGYEAYGQFLVSQSRHQEAVQYLKKALSLTTHSQGEQLLVDLERLAAN